MSARVIGSLVFVLLFVFERSLAKQKDYRGYWVPWVLVFGFWIYTGFFPVRQPQMLAPVPVPVASIAAVPSPISPKPDYASLLNKNRGDVRQLAATGMAAFEQGDFPECQQSLDQCYFLEDAKPEISRYGEEYAVSCPLNEMAILLQKPDAEHYRAFHKSIDHLISDIETSAQRPDISETGKNWLKIKLNDCIIPHLYKVQAMIPLKSEKDYLSVVITKASVAAKHKL